MLHGYFPAALIHVALLTRIGRRCRWVGTGSSLGGGGRGTALTGAAQDDDGDGVQVHELKHLAGRLAGTAPASPAAASAGPCSGATSCTCHTQPHRARASHSHTVHVPRTATPGTCRAQPQPQSCCQPQLRLDGELFESSREKR